MTRTTTSRPRMAASYAPGTVRVHRRHGEGDVRGYRPPRAGWPAPTSPTFTTSKAAPCRAPCGGSSRRRNNHDRRRAQAVPSWARWTQDPDAEVAAGSNVQSKIATALRAARQSVPAGAGEVSMAPRRDGQGLWGYAPARCGRLCESVPPSTLAIRCLSITKDGSPTAAQPRYGASMPRLKHVAAICGRGVLALSSGH